MGNCIVSALAWRSDRAEVPLSEAEALRSYGLQSVAVDGTETSDSSAIYLNGKRATLDEQRKLAKEFHDGPNQAQRFQKLCEDHLDDVAMVYRKVEKTEKEKVGKKQKEMEIAYLSDRIEIPYKELYDTYMSFSRGLAELGLDKRANVSIYEETRWEWLAAIYGIWMQDMVASTVYANLGEDALFYALRETECAAIVCNGKSVPLLLRGAKEENFSACTIIYFDDLPDLEGEDTHGCKVVAWSEVVEMGRSESGKKRPAEAPTDNDSVGLIMYTSGTTGNPKGVEHTHGSIIAGVLALDDWLYSCVEQRPDDSYCAYLPLAHIMEFAVVNILLARRALVGFGNPRTLTDATARPHGDLTEYKPSFFVGVPRIFDTLMKTVQGKLPRAGTLQRSIFNAAYQRRLKALKEGKDTPYFNDKVFKPARAALGGRVRAMLSGGGPLAADTQEFVNVVFGLMVIGWGLTETVCVGALQRLGDLTPGCTGQVIATEELKLADAEDYKHTDEEAPRGEICLRGPFLFKGYYKQPDLTKEAIDEDGWFHTGDIGSIDKEGRLSIVGRLKALAKNGAGEYIAMEALEAIYSNHPLIRNNCMCVLVHPDKKYIGALAATDKEKVSKYAKEHHIDGEFPALLEDERLLKKLAQDLEDTGKEQHRKNFEMVRHVCLVDDDWSPENGQMTAAMKLKRDVIDKQYEEEINKLFESE